MGTNDSKGAKVFALAGKLNNTGLIEVPMGITLEEIVNEMGGGAPSKAVAEMRKKRGLLLPTGGQLGENTNKTRLIKICKQIGITGFG